jgi:hypothetical protein
MRVTSAAMSDPDLCQEISRNPVHLARLKAPKAYQTESPQTSIDEEVKALLAVVALTFALQMAVVHVPFL